MSSGSETSLFSATTASSSASISSGSETSLFASSAAFNRASISSGLLSRSVFSLVTNSFSDNRPSKSPCSTRSLSSISIVSSLVLVSSSKPANKESKSLWSNWPPSKASLSTISSSNESVSKSSSKEMSSRSSKSASSSSSWITSSSSNSSSSEPKSSENKSSCSSSTSDKSIDSSSSSESSLSKETSSSNNNSLSTLSCSAVAATLASGSDSVTFSFLAATTLTSLSLFDLRRNKIAIKDSSNNAGKVAINATNQVLDIKLLSLSSAFCFSSNNACSLASAFANNSCCSAIMLSIWILISLLFATSLCITSSCSLKLPKRWRNASFSFNKLCKPSIESKTSFWIVARRCCWVLSMAFNWTLISDFAASKSFLLTDASSGGLTFLATTLTTFFCHALSSLRDFCCALAVLIARITSIDGIFKYWPLIIWFKLLSLKESGLFSNNACMTW